MTTMNCKTCRTLLPDLLFEPGSLAAREATPHLAACAECRAELDELRATMSLMTAWTAPDPSPYFDARVRAHLREAEQSAPVGLLERLLDTLRFSTGRGLRSALAGVFLFILLLGGGTVATLWNHQSARPAASPVVNDLRIFDNNAQAVQQMDLLDEPGSDAGNNQPQS